MILSSLLIPKMTSKLVETHHHIILNHRLSNLEMPNSNVPSHGQWKVCIQWPLQIFSYQANRSSKAFQNVSSPENILATSNIGLNFVATDGTLFVKCRNKNKGWFLLTMLYTNYNCLYKGKRRGEWSEPTAREEGYLWVPALGLLREERWSREGKVERKETPIVASAPRFVLHRLKKKTETTRRGKRILERLTWQYVWRMCVLISREDIRYEISYRFVEAISS